MQHVNHLLGEYHDGELNARQRRQVEAHLDECETCRAELASLTRLSSLMQAYTLPKTLMPPETFRSRVMLQVARRKRQPRTSWVWYAVPAGLGSVLILLQATIVLLLLLLSALSWSGLDIAASLMPGWLEWLGAQTWWGNILISSGLGLLNLIAYVSLCVVLVLLFIPYAGWVGLLWRSVHKSLAE